MVYDYKHNAFVVLIENNAWVASLTINTLIIHTCLRELGNLPDIKVISTDLEFVSLVQAFQKIGQ